MSKIKSIVKSKRFLIPLALTVIFVPLVTRFVKSEFYSSSMKYDLFHATSHYQDLFLFYKGKTLSFLAITIMTFAIAFTKGSIKKAQVTPVLLLGSLALLMTLSAFFSEYPEIVWKGVPPTFEGYNVLISYVVICFSVIVLVKDKYDIQFLVGALLVGATCVSFFALLQLINIDYLNSTFFKWFIFSDEINKKGVKLSTFQNLTSTLYNANYAGSYTSMLVFIASITFLYLKKRSHLILTLIVYALIFTFFICTGSRAAYLGGGSAFIVFLFFYRKKIKTNIKKMSVIVGVSVMSVLFVNTLKEEFFHWTICKNKVSGGGFRVKKEHTKS